MLAEKEAGVPMTNSFTVLMYAAAWGYADIVEILSTRMLRK